jgi:hypothetical protein
MLRTLLSLTTAVVLGGLSCTVDSARIVGPDEWDVVFQSPHQAVEAITASPDGVLFVATTDSVYRYIPGGAATFEPLMPGQNAPQVLAAPSRRVIYHMVWSGGHVVRWQEGVGETLIEMPPLEPWMTCGGDCFRSTLQLFALWAPSENEAWAAGRYGAVVHIVNDAGRLERTPMLEFARTAIGTLDIYRADLRYIAGDADALYIGGPDALLHHGSGGWDTLPNPWRRSPGCGAMAMVLQGSTQLFGGHTPFPTPELPCVIAITGDHTERLDSELRGFGQPGIFGGALQPDGSALFHASSAGRSEIAVFRGRRGQVLSFPELKWFGGAAIIGRYVYAGGRIGENAVVIRAPLGSRYTVPRN